MEATPQLAPGFLSLAETLESIPSEFRVNIAYLEGGLLSDSRNMVTDAIMNANSLIGRMTMIRQGFGGDRYMGQPIGEVEKTNLLRASEYLSGVVAAAQVRLAGMR